MTSGFSCMTGPWRTLPPQMWIRHSPSIMKMTAGPSSASAVAHSLGGEYNVPHGLANAVLLPFVLEAYGNSIHKKLHRLAIEAGVAEKDTPCEEAAQNFIHSIQEMKEHFGIGNTISEIREEDIPKLARYADKEANPLYPVPVLMDAKELEKFYHLLMKTEHRPETVPHTDTQAAPGTDVPERKENS